MMFLTDQRASRAATAVAVALALAPAGCAGNRKPDATPVPTGSVNVSMDPARVGDRSGNPSCETPVERASRLRWREVQWQRRWTGLPLAPGVAVEARRRGGAWSLTIAAPSGKRSEHRVSQRVMHLAFNGSCSRRLYRLHAPLTAYRYSIVRRENAQRFGPGDELVVTDAGVADGQRTWTVEHGDDPEYAAFADDLRRAGTPSDDVPVGRWRDEPEGFFFRLDDAVKAASGDRLPRGTRISLASTVSCGATRGDDVLGLRLYPDGELRGVAEVRRGDLLRALSDVARIKEPKARDWVTGTGPSDCPDE
jgi:hypothetical protein